MFGAAADWVVAPDIVAGGPASLDLSLSWLDRCLSACPRVLLAVQDGLTPIDVSPFLGARVGLFVGGSTDWKIATMRQWGALGRDRGCWVHVGRVNTARRINYCHDAGVTSFDGTSASRFAVSLPPLDNARRQCHLF
jgi:hypothetical protein